MGNIQPWLISALTIFEYSSLYFIVDLWLPRAMNSMFIATLSSLFIGSNGQTDPLDKLLLIRCQFGWCINNFSRYVTGRNSEPGQIKDPGWASINAYILSPCTFNTFMLKSAAAWDRSNLSGGWSGVATGELMISVMVERNHWGVSTMHNMEKFGQILNIWGK